METSIKLNKAEYKRVCEELESGQPLDLMHILRVFGLPAAELFIYAFMDSQSAARAIQLATLKMRGLVNEDVVTDDE